jgi:hypothetical protein
MCLDVINDESPSDLKQREQHDYDYLVLFPAPILGGILPYPERARKKAE